jgi:hypothetical protein
VPSLWPFIPEREIVEALSWATDILTFEDGEQRLATRPIPRGELSFDYQMTPAQFGRARELARSIGGSTCYVPAWHEAEHVGAVSAHQVSLAIDPVGKCYSESGYLLVWDAEDDCEVVAIGSFGVGQINLDPWVVSAYADAWVAPIREATFAQEFEAPRDAVDTFVRASARFEVLVTEDLSAETLAEDSYKTYPIVEDPPEAGSSDQFWREVDVLDTVTGLSAKTSIIDIPMRSSTVGWLCHDAAEVWGRRVWLHKRRGRQGAFWLPSWNTDVVVTVDIGAGDQHLHIAEVSFDELYSMPCDLVIETTGGAFVPLRVMSAADGDPGEEILTLESVFSGGLDAADIARVGKLTLSRLNSDRIEIQHRPGGGAIIAAPTIEVPAP